jgi:cytochrome c peroxidase
LNRFNLFIRNSKAGTLKVPAFAILSFCILILIASFSDKELNTTPEELCRTSVLYNITEIITSLEKSKQLLSAKNRSSKNNNDLILEYTAARKYYKEIEFFVEYYSPFDSKYYINGPLVPKNDIEFGPQIFEPMGFQVIEENLFIKSKTNIEVLNTQYQLLITKFKELKDYYTSITIDKANLEEALRLQLIRTMCLTLNGYDCTINKATLKECTYSFNGLINVFNNFSNTATEQEKELLSKVQNNFTFTLNYLRKNTNSDNFNRLHFTTKYLNPTYNLICNYFDLKNTGSSQVNYAVNFKIHKVFSINSIDKQHFSLYRNDTTLIKQQAALGKLLFFDPILSGNNKRACASCHKPELAFTDGLDKSFAFDNESKIVRNSPTLLNAAYQKLYFMDGRVLNLEEQAGQVFQNTFEMNTTNNEIVSKLKLSEEYSRFFKESFKGQMDTSITFYAVMKAIAEYIKTLDSKNSRFDQYINGDTTQLNANEINGYNLFAGKALCGSCHFYPLFNGLVPPMYNDNEFEVIGTPEKKDNKSLDTDMGRESITHSTIHQHAFKTPSVRNIALTAPYMHNGVYKTLDEVLEFYNKGGGAGLNLNVPNQTLPFDSLQLTKNELKSIKAFLLSLTDTSKTTHVPKKLPSFSNPILNKRKIGGEY